MKKYKIKVSIPMYYSGEVEAVSEDNIRENIADYLDNLTDDYGEIEIDLIEEIDPLLDAAEKAINDE